eukprot:8712306-Pyramimonas_sp.AAC.1
MRRRRRGENGGMHGGGRKTRIMRSTNDTCIRGGRKIRRMMRYPRSLPTYSNHGSRMPPPNPNGSSALPYLVMTETAANHNAYIHAALKGGVQDSAVGCPNDLALDIEPRRICWHGHLNPSRRPKGCSSWSSS